MTDGEVKTYSAADVVVLYAAYKNYVTKHTTYCNLLKKWIKRETDNAVIGAIQYGDNLPEDLTAQMKTILDAATAQLTSITTAVSDGAFADKISSLENQMTETQMALVRCLRAGHRSDFGYGGIKLWQEFTRP